MQTALIPKLLFKHGWIFSVVTVVGVFLFENLNSMLLQNMSMDTPSWYPFLAAPTTIGEAGLLDSAAMSGYYRTLSTSLGHLLLINSTEWFGEPASTVILYVLIVALFSSGIYLLSSYWAKSKWKAFLISLLLINSDAIAMGHIGAAGHIASQVSRDYLAMAFIIHSLYFLLTEKYYRYLVFLYIGFLFHIPQGLFAFIILLPLTLYKTQSLKFLACHFGIFGLTVLSLHLHQSSVAFAVSPEIEALWYKWLYIFNGGHIFFDHSIDYLVPNYAYFSLIFAGLSIALLTPEKRVFLISIIAAWCLIALIGTFFIYVNPEMLAFQLTPYRSSLLISIVLLIIILNFLLDCLRTDCPFWANITALAGIVACLSGTFIGLSIGALLLITLVKRKHIRFKRTTTVFLIGCCILMVASSFDYAQYDYFVVTRDRTYWFLLLLAGGCAYFLSLSKIKTSKFLNVANVSAVLLICFLTFVPSRYVNSVTQNRFDILTDFRNAAAVIEQNSNERDPILTAPMLNMPMLETAAHRGSVMQLSKAHVAILAPALLPRLDDALISFGIDIKNFEGNWIDLNQKAPIIWKSKMTTEYVKEMAEKYRTPLLFTYQDHIVDLPVLYAGSHFTVYKFPE